MTSRVGVREAKARFSHFVEMAQAGAEVVITDRGHPVARLVAARPAKEPSEADVWEELEGLGLLERATGAAKPPRAPITLRGRSSIVALVREMRR